MQIYVDVYYIYSYEDHIIIFYKISKLRNSPDVAFLHISDMHLIMFSDNSVY